MIKRHTNRKPFENRPIEPEKLQKLKDCIDREGFRPDTISDIEGKIDMADILAKSQKIQLDNKEKFDIYS